MLSEILKFMRPYISPGGQGWPHVHTCPSRVSTTECVPPAATYDKEKGD